MAGGRVVSFDSSNKYFVDAQETNLKISEEISSLEDKINNSNKEIASLKEISPVGYIVSKKLDISSELNEIETNWQKIMINANRVREIGDLLNKGIMNDFDKLFNNKETFASFISKVAKGEKTISDLLGNSIFQSIDYYEILKDGYTVQGYTEIFKNNKDRILITAHGGKYDNARVYIYDKKSGKLESVIIFNNSDHVGGITYDSTNDILWVASDEGKVHSYDYKALNEILEVKSKDTSSNKLYIGFNDRKYSNIEIDNNIELRDLLTKGNNKQDGMDSIYYHDGKLYSCTYGAKGELVETSVNVNRTREGVTITDSSKIVGNLNGATQGLAVYEEDGKKYAITASSAAFASSQSRLTKWELTDNGLEPLGYKYINHTGLEGIEIEDGYVKGVFEQGFSIWNQNQSTEVLSSINDICEEANSTVDSHLAFGGGFWDTINGQSTEYIY